MEHFTNHRLPLHRGHANFSLYGSNFSTCAAELSSFRKMIFQVSKINSKYTTLPKPALCS